MNVSDIFSNLKSQNVCVKLDSDAKQALLERAAYVHARDDDYFVVDHDSKFYACILSTLLDKATHELLICDAHKYLHDAMSAVDKQFRIDVLDSEDDDRQMCLADIYMLDTSQTVTIYTLNAMKDYAVYKCDRNAHAFVAQLANKKYRACMFSASENEFCRVLLATDHEYLSEAIAALSIAQQLHFQHNVVALHDFDLNANHFEFTIKRIAYEANAQQAFYHARFDYETKQLTTLHCDVSEFELARCDEVACNDMNFLSRALDLASALAFAACE